MAWAHTDCRSIQKFTQVRQEARLARKNQGCSLRGREKRKKRRENCSLVFNLSSSRGVNKYFVSDSLMSAVIETPNFIRRLSDSALSGLKATQAEQYGKGGMLILALQQMFRSCCSCLLFENRSDAPSVGISQSLDLQWTPFIIFLSGQIIGKFDDDRQVSNYLILNVKPCIITHTFLTATTAIVTCLTEKS